MPSFGFFREIGYRPDGPSLYACLSAEAHPNEAQIVSYLRAGQVEMARFGTELDALDPQAGSTEGDVEVVTAPDGTLWALMQQPPLLGAPEEGEASALWVPFEPGYMRPRMVRGVAGTGSILTDGTWRWPDTLAHYVERYHVQLPEAFVLHMAGQQWAIPQPVKAV